jgi:membrane protein DedA with SNARE-associated domain
MSQDQLPGVFGDVQPILEHYGYLAVGGFVLLEDFGVPVPGEAIMIAAADKWYMIGAATVIVIAVVAHGIRRPRASTPETP